MRKEDKGVADAISPLFPARPNCRYRLKAYARSNARNAAGNVCLPVLFVYSNKTRHLGWFATPLGYAEDPTFTGRVGWKELTWFQIGEEFQTGPDDTEIRIYCRQIHGVGEGWIDDITLEIVEILAPPAGNLATSAAVTVPVADSLSSLDGSLTAAAWKSAAAAGPFRDRGGRTASWLTRAHLFRDRDYLYVGFDCRDQDPSAIRRSATSESQVWQDDAVAVLLQPDPRTEDHLQFAVSASGTRLDQVATAAGQDTATFNPDWKAAVRIGDTGWTAEMRIPISLLAAKGVLQGMRWGMNLGRRQRDGSWPSWCPTDNWHNVRDYGLLVF